MKRLLLTFSLLVLLTTNVFAQTFTAKTNRSELPAGEVLVLTLLYSGPEVNETIDISSINKDFTIYSTSSSSSTQFYNGTTTHNKKWEISLIPNKTEGTITIPEIKLGSLKSKPINIKINNNMVEKQDASKEGKYQDANNDRPKYSIKTKIDNNNPFVQQQVKYLIIIEDTGSLQISEPKFEDNINQEWSIKSLGSPSIRNVTKDGKTIREIIFNYIIFPQKSGILKLPEATIDGYYLKKAEDPNVKHFTDAIINNFFSDNFSGVGNTFSEMFATRVPLIMRTGTKNIEVKAKPEIDGLNWWLPAKDVKIYSQWKTPKSNFMVGEAISRTIEIEAIGAISSQIPNVNFMIINDVKQYPEKPILSSSLNSNGDVISISEINNVYIPSKVGKVTIPEVEVTWFNTTTNKLEKAILDSVTIDILPNNNATSKTTNKEEKTSVEEKKAKGLMTEGFGDIKPSVKKGNVKEDVDFNIFNKKKLSKADIYTIGIIAIIVLGIIFHMMFSARKKGEEKFGSFEVDYRKNAIIAAGNHDFKTLRNCLISWARKHFKDAGIYNLDDIKRHIYDINFSRELDAISANLYSEENIIWDEENFIRLFEKINNTKQKSVEHSPVLPNLYKD